MTEPSKLAIVSAAIRYKPPRVDPDCPEYETALIVSVPAPGRHHTILHPLYQLNSGAALEGEQGFLLSDGRFLDRREAKEFVRESGQPTIRSTDPNQLFSEDLW